MLHLVIIGCTTLPHLETDEFEDGLNSLVRSSKPFRTSSDVTVYAMIYGSSRTMDRDRIARWASFNLYHLADDPNPDDMRLIPKHVVLDLESRLMSSTTDMLVTIGSGNYSDMWEGICREAGKIGIQARNMIG
jgi:hypothetical protein